MGVSASLRNLFYCDLWFTLQHNVDELLVGILKQVKHDLWLDLWYLIYSLTVFIYVSFCPKDSLERDSREEAVILKNEKFTNSFVTSYGQRNSSKDMLQSAGHYEIKKLWKFTCLIDGFEDEGDYSTWKLSRTDLGEQSIRWKIRLMWIKSRHLSFNHYTRQ